MIKIIDKTIEIADLINQYPTSVNFLSEKGIKCVACGEPIWGTLEEAAIEKGFNTEQIEAVVVELNNWIGKTN
jgi:iron-sulfur cluster repair protein YtfE (RIC family)